MRNPFGSSIFATRTGAEILLEELARRLAARACPRRAPAADLDQRRINRPRVARTFALPTTRGSLPETSQRRPHDRRRPSRRFAPGHRLEARVGKADRSGRIRLAGEFAERRRRRPLGLGPMRAARLGVLIRGKQTAQRESRGASECSGVPRTPPCRSTARLRSRPASSWDRARRDRARRSTRRSHR